MKTNVFQTKIQQKTYYFCFSDGEIINGDMYFSEAGAISLNTLLGIEPQFNCNFVYYQFGDSIPSRIEIKELLLQLPDHSKVCLFGNMSDELDNEVWEDREQNGLA